ncbi:hypothetical protein L1987_22609 [Smallanthus sonchifolius]|uniref:Uncharacterized protein n=1 Tax=Smallanthus sonchifolius TaxID=185202 RepID=A0ACB9IGT5_9ASTR|nr:hypothetical protein L1987_22609 [Smallanthus sonchifolius]
MDREVKVISAPDKAVVALPTNEETEAPDEVNHSPNPTSTTHSEDLADSDLIATKLTKASSKVLQGCCYGGLVMLPYMVVAWEKLVLKASPMELLHVYIILHIINHVHSLCLG